NLAELHMSFRTKADRRYSAMRHLDQNPCRKLAFSRVGIAQAAKFFPRIRHNLYTRNSLEGSTTTAPSPVENLSCSTCHWSLSRIKQHAFAAGLQVRRPHRASGFSL